MSQLIKYDLSELERATSNFHAYCLIGQGGFGKVYRTMINLKPVAIKKWTEGLQGEAEFETERRMGVELAHPFIVRLLGYAETAARPSGSSGSGSGKNSISNRNLCLVYELLSNGNLEEHLAPGGGLPWTTRVRIVAQVASALTYMHKQRVLHCDLKPSNIFLDHSLKAKLGDLGMSRRLAVDTTPSSSSSSSSSPSVVGTSSGNVAAAAAAAATSAAPYAPAPATSFNYHPHQYPIQHPPPPPHNNHYSHYPYHHSPQHRHQHTSSGSSVNYTSLSLPLPTTPATSMTSASLLFPSFSAQPSTIPIPLPSPPPSAPLPHAAAAAIDDGGEKSLIGTWGYLAPEYITSGRNTLESDVFSFGVILLQIVTGTFSNNDGAIGREVGLEGRTGVGLGRSASQGGGWGGGESGMNTPANASSASNRNYPLHANASNNSPNQHYMNNNRNLNSPQTNHSNPPHPSSSANRGSDGWNAVGSKSAPKHNIGLRDLVQSCALALHQGSFESLVEEGGWDLLVAMRMLKLGLWCCHEKASQRPSIQTVATELARLLQLIQEAQGVVQEAEAL